MVRVFYVENVHKNVLVGSALQCVFEGWEPNGLIVGATRTEWEQWAGGSCPFDLIPWRPR